MDAVLFHKKVYKSTNTHTQQFTASLKHLS